MLISFFSGIVIFCESEFCVPPSFAELRAFSFLDIVVFGRLLCPNMNKAWNEKEVGYHAGTNDYWVSVRGVVYDLSKYYKRQ